MPQPTFHADMQEINDGLVHVATELKAFAKERDEAAARLLHLEQVVAKGENAGTGFVRASGGTRVLTQAIESDAMAALRGKSSRSAIVPVDASVLDVRNAITSDGSGAYSTPAQFDPRIGGVAIRPLSLIDLLPVIAVTGGSFEYNRITSAFANAAGYQLTQGATKPSQDVPMALQVANIATIASVTGVSEQVLQDSESLQQRLGALLVNLVSTKLETELISGAGGAGKIQGLTVAGTAFTPTGTPTAEDGLSEAAAHLQSLGWNPSAVLLNPADWHAIRTSKAATSGVYLSGSYAQPPVPNLWGVPAVVSAAVTAGTAILLDTQQCALLDRRAVVIEVGRIDNDFSQNIVRLRCELRAGLAIFAPSAVLVVSLT